MNKFHFRMKVIKIKEKQFLIKINFAKLISQNYQWPENVIEVQVMIVNKSLSREKVYGIESLDFCFFLTCIETCYG